MNHMVTTTVSETLGTPTPRAVSVRLDTWSGELGGETVGSIQFMLMGMLIAYMIRYLVGLVWLWKEKDMDMKKIKVERDEHSAGVPAYLS